jgi:hypothetical protein
VLTRFSLRALAAIAVLVAALSFVACGGGDKAMSKDEYKKEAQKISDKADTDFQGALKNATSQDPQESLTGVNQMKTSATEAADALDKLDPPKDFKDVHGKLVGALRTMQKRGEAVDQAAKGDDKAAIQSAVQSFQQSIKELDTVGNEFDKKVGTT